MELPGRSIYSRDVLASWRRYLATWLIVSVMIDTAVTVTGEIEQLTKCSARTDEGIIDLSPLTENMEAQLAGEQGGVWNYTFNPCYPFTKMDGFGDKCVAAALCKHGQSGKRKYQYHFGLDTQAKFIIMPNSSDVAILYPGILSSDWKKTYVKLICDRERVAPGDALFKVIRDITKFIRDPTPHLETITTYAELHHVSCCPGGAITNQSDVTSLLKETKDNKLDTVDRTKVMIIVGVNFAVILMAGCVGFMCYSKKSHLEIYHKLPGIRNVHEQKQLWQLANSQDIEQPGSGPITSASINGPSKGGPSKAGYRDGAPHRRKSFCFPILETSMIPSNSIVLGQRLGGGLFADTYMAEWTGIPVAVKRITLSVHRQQIDPENITHLQDQVSFLSKQRHRNIVSMLGFCAETKHPYIISELIQGQLMKDFIKHAGTQLQWPHRVKILSQIADGMAFLHSTNPPILHRDLRCGNLFLTSNDIVKICDFGIVKVTQPLRANCQEEHCCCQGLYSACPATIAWTAPEVLAHPLSDETEGYITTASDVYSYAVVMWELVMCEDPYEEMHIVQEVIDHVLSGGRPELPKDGSMYVPYLSLMQKCWQTSVIDRYSFKQISVHLKEVLYQAKVYQKQLNHKQSQQNKPPAKTVTISEHVENIPAPPPTVEDETNEEKT